jgi:hypothetical protein
MYPDISFHHRRRKFLETKHPFLFTENRRGEQSTLHMDYTDTAVPDLLFTPTVTTTQDDTARSTRSY